jgi:hypothetical protein
VSLVLARPTSKGIRKLARRGWTNRVVGVEGANSRSWCPGSSVAVARESGVGGRGWEEAGRKRGAGCDKEREVVGGCAAPQPQQQQQQQQQQQKQQKPPSIAEGHLEGGGPRAASPGSRRHLAIGARAASRLSARH